MSRDKRTFLVKTRVNSIFQVDSSAIIQSEAIKMQLNQHNLENISEKPEYFKNDRMGVTKVYVHKRRLK